MRRGSANLNEVMYKWLIPILLALIVSVLGIGFFRSSSEPPEAGDSETRIVRYLDANVGPGRFVLVTDLYNNVFTTAEEQAALERLYNSAIEIPAYVAQVYIDTARIPTLQEIADGFEFEVPGTADVLLRVLEVDPRLPPFFARDPATGEITEIDVEAVRAHERFGRPLRDVQ